MSKIRQIKIKISNCNYIVLSNILDKLNFFNKDLMISIVKLNNKKKLYTVLRSPHVNKTARDQFELIKHSIIIKINIKNGNINKKILLAVLKIIKTESNFAEISFN